MTNISSNSQLSAFALAVTLLVLGLIACTPPAGEDAGVNPGSGVSSAAPREQARRQVNLGVAYLAQFQAASAISSFHEALRLDPDNLAATVDLGIAYRVAADLAESRVWLEKAILLAPEQMNALYNLALIERVQGAPEAALEHLDQVISLAPQDPSTHYNRGQVLNQLQRREEALAAFDRVLEEEEWNASAHYARGRVLLQMGREADAMAALEKSQELSGGQMMATTAGQQYGEQGVFSLAIEDMPVNPLAGEAAPVIFTDMTAASGVDFVHGGGPGGAGASGWGSGLVLFDVDGDHDLDLFLGDAGEKNPSAADRLYLNDGSGHFSMAALPAETNPGASTGVTIGDYDNDGHTDIYVGRFGANRLLRNQGDHTFLDVAVESGVANAGETLATSFGDLDHDGDLDLVLADQVEGLIYLRNDGDGTFSRQPQAHGLAGSASATGILPLDVDGDRDVDLLATGPAGLDLWLNNRDGSYSRAAESWGQSAAGTGLRGILPLDLEKDGVFDLILTGEQGAVALSNNGRHLSSVAEALPAVPDSFGMAVADLDLDGFQDLVIAAATGSPIRLLRNLGGRRFEALSGGTALASLQPGPARGLAAGDLDGDGDPDLVVGLNGGAVQILRNDLPPRRWVAVQLDGLHSNRTGLGTRVAVRAGGLWDQIWMTGSGGYLGGGTTRPTFGLGRWEKVDAVSLLWPGGVLQDEIDPALGSVTKVKELDRKGSSCPTLFAWDGKRFNYLADFIGGGVLGLYLAPGVRYQPDPEELHLVRSGQQLELTDAGKYELRITDNLEEVTYMDAVGLTAVDHPAGLTVLPREGLQPMPPYPAPDLLVASTVIDPVAARDGDGRNWLPQILAVDRTYPEVPLEQRLGYARMHELTVTFPEIPAGESVWLWAHGTLEFSNSTPNFATAQHGGGLVWPALELQDAQGEYQVIIPGMTIPMGADKPALMDLSAHLGEGPVVLRVRTSMEIYWDRLALIGTSPAEGMVQVTRLQPETALLRPFGFPLWASEDGLLPRTFIYEKAHRLDTWKTLPGRYTRFGPVDELVASADDLLVVMAPGDELAVTFDPGRLPPLAPGWIRTWLIAGHGWVKDTDAHTPAAGRVDPLPFAAMGPFPPAESEYWADPRRAAFAARYNTRLVGDRDPLRRWPTGSAVAPTGASD